MIGIAVAPDGKHVYVTNLTNDGSGSVSAIDTASNKVVAFIPVGYESWGIAVNPDGRHAYVTTLGDSNRPGAVSVIDTASNEVTATIPAGFVAYGLAIAPDGTRAYVANAGFTNSAGTVSVIDTTSNKVVATVPVGNSPLGVAVTPDGKRVYVPNYWSTTVSVIDTASNKVAATVPVAVFSTGVGIAPPPPKTFFSAFNAKLDLRRNHDSFELQAAFTLGQASNGIDPAAEAVTLEVGDFTATIPPGSFEGQGFGPFAFDGVINGTALNVLIQPTGTKRYALSATAQGANLAGTRNPVTVTVTLMIGDDTGTATVKADTAQNTPPVSGGSALVNAVPQRR